jgi:predicted RND superfamily exporter protein
MHQAHTHHTIPDAPPYTGNTRAERWLDRFLHHRKSITVAAAFCVALLAAACVRITIDNGLEVWFVHSDPAWQQYQRFIDHFGNDEVVVTAVVSPDGELGVERLARLDRLTTGLQRIKGVAAVKALTNFKVADGPSFARSPTPVVEGEVQQDDVDRARFALSRPLARRFASADARTLVLYTWMDRGTDGDRPRILEEIRTATNASLARGEAAHHAGMGVLYDAINLTTMTDGSLFIGLSYIVIVLGLYWLTRSWKWTLAAVVAVTAADICLFGVMALMDKPVTMFTMALPALVMVMGMANALHIAQAVQTRTDGTTPTQAAASALTPCVLNTATECAGFLSLLAARTSITRDFGLFGALGVFLAFTFVLLVTPWVIGGATAAPVTARVSNLTARCMTAGYRMRHLVLLATLVLVGVSYVGGTRVVVDTTAAGFLPDRHAFHSDLKVVTDAVGNIIPLEITLQPASPDAWSDVEFLAGVRAAQDELEKTWGPQSTLSVVNLLAQVREASRTDPVEPSWIPETPEEATFLRNLLGMVGQEADIGRFLHASTGALRLTVFVPLSSSLTYKARALDVAAVVKRHVPSTVTVGMGGYLPLNWRMAEQVVADQMSSFATAFLVVFLIILLMLRSWRLALLAIPSNVLPVVMVFGLMGFAGIPLDIATVTIAATVLGVVVDDTVHVLYEFHQLIRRGMRLEAALEHVARGAASAVFSTTALLVAGFSVIAVSSVHSVAWVGLLSGVAILFALLADLFLLPALMAFLLPQPEATPDTQSSLVAVEAP